MFWFYFFVKKHSGDNMDPILSRKKKNNSFHKTKKKSVEFLEDTEKRPKNFCQVKAINYNRDRLFIFFFQQFIYLSN